MIMVFDKNGKKVMTEGEYKNKFGHEYPQDVDKGTLEDLKKLLAYAKSKGWIT